jgi:hypothetical protein
MNVAFIGKHDTVKHLVDNMGNIQDYKHITSVVIDKDIKFCDPELKVIDYKLSDNELVDYIKHKKIDYLVLTESIKGISNNLIKSAAKATILLSADEFPTLIGSQNAVINYCSKNDKPSISPSITMLYPVAKRGQLLYSNKIDIPETYINQYCYLTDLVYNEYVNLLTIFFNFIRSYGIYSRKFIKCKPIVLSDIAKYKSINEVEIDYINDNNEQEVIEDKEAIEDKEIIEDKEVIDNKDTKNIINKQKNINWNRTAKEIHKAISFRLENNYIATRFMGLKIYVTKSSLEIDKDIEINEEENGEVLDFDANGSYVLCGKNTILYILDIMYEDSSKIIKGRFNKGMILGRND